MSPSHGFNSDSGIQEDLVLSEFVSVPLDRLTEIVETLMNHGYTEIFLQDPTTGKKIRLCYEIEE